MKRLKIIFLGMLANIDGLYPILPIFLGLFLFIAGEKISSFVGSITGNKSYQDVTEKILISSAFFLCGTQGLIFAKYKEFPGFFGPIAAKGKIAVVAGVIFALIFFAFFLMFVLPPPK
jgi:hypothetical protein